MKTNSDRRIGTWWLGAAVALLVAAACSGAATTGSASSLSVAPSSTPGITSIQRTFIGVGEHPTVTVEAPSHQWHTFKGFAVVSDCCGIAFWDVGEVARNPCHSIGNLVDPGPTVDDLVAALVAQSMRHATKPTDVTLGGYSGKNLEWSVPRQWVVTGDGDF